jgi:RNA polymerase sigma factor (sigma-70 family)
MTAICTEDLLLSRWRAGDRAAGDELARICKPVLRSFFRRRTTKNIDELVQRTLVACIQSLDSFEGRSSFRAFLLGIAHKQFLMNLRSSRRREMPATPPMQSAECPSQLFASKEDEQTVAAALSDTAPPFRQVLELFYWGDLSIDEIARTLGLPAGTVKSRLTRGRSMVKARIVGASGFAEAGDRGRKTADCLLRLENSPDSKKAKIGNLSLDGSTLLDLHPTQRSSSAFGRRSPAPRPLHEPPGRTRN